MMNYKALILIIAVSLTACARGGTFEEELLSDKILIFLKFHDTIESVQRECGEGTAACAAWSADHTLAVIHSIKDRDCVGHEIDHVLFGQWHDGRKAGCSARAKLD